MATDVDATQRSEQELFAYAGIDPLQFIDAQIKQVFADAAAAGEPVISIKQLVDTDELRHMIYAMATLKKLAWLRRVMISNDTDLVADHDFSSFREAFMVLEDLSIVIATDHGIIDNDEAAQVLKEQESELLNTIADEQ